MVPSRSRKTAGRSVVVSGRTRLPRHRGNPVACGGFYGGGRDARHAAVVCRAAAQKTGTAVGFFLNDAVTWCDGRGAERIGRAEDGYDREADGRGYMHCAGVVADEEIALRKKRRHIFDGGFSGEVDRRLAHACDDSRGYSGFVGRTEKNHVGAGLRLKTIGEFGETIRRPAFRWAVGCARADGDAKAVGLRAVRKKKVGRSLFVFCRHLDLY